ncbi:protein BIG GRAIN 1-like D [Capsella rubella]|nr:protein BIG GRAIN 1-like D [Capsella rubella]
MHKSKRNPSFSSTLLDEIYNSIDPKTQKTQSFVGSVNTTTKKQSIVSRSVPDRKIHRDRFFGSVSSSSDSNSSIFSSSDTELTHGKKVTSSRPLCFGPSKSKPRKTEDKTLYHQNRASRVYDDYDYSSDVPKFTRHDENWENNRFRRSAKSSGNPKKPKTPASPAGRIVNFINSLFSNNSSKQSNAVKSYPRKTSYDDSAFVRKTSNDYHSSSTTCSSASSFSRSCMNKSYEKSSERIKRSVKFSPVNVIVPEIFTNKEDDYFSNMRKSVKKNVEDGGRRSVEEIAREFLRDYHKNHESSLVKNSGFEDYEDDEDDDDDDVASDSSSDLFELDLVGNNHHHHNNVYGDELPVYETTFAGLIS